MSALNTLGHDVEHKLHGLPHSSLLLRLSVNLILPITAKLAPKGHINLQKPLSINILIINKIMA